MVDGDECQWREGEGVVVRGRKMVNVVWVNE